MVVPCLTISITNDYYGADLSGTEYCNININSTSGFNMPIRFVSENSFMMNGQVASKTEDRYVLNSRLTHETTTYAVEKFECDYISMQMTIDISDPSPIVTYHLYYTNRPRKDVENHFAALGMNVDYCDDKEVLLSEEFETINDFQYVFPIRVYSIFGIVTTVNMKQNEFFFSKANFELTMCNDEGRPPVVIEVTSQENTKFTLTQNNKTEESTGKDCNIKLDGMTTITASYSNIRWFATMTSILAIAAIALAALCMFYFAKKTTRRL